MYNACCAFSLYQGTENPSHVNDNFLFLQLLILSNLKSMIWQRHLGCLIHLHLTKTVLRLQMHLCAIWSIETDTFDSLFIEVRSIGWEIIIAFDNGLASILNQWWPSSETHLCGTKGTWVNLGFLRHIRNISLYLVLCDHLSVHRIPATGTEGLNYPHRTDVAGVLISQMYMASPCSF